MRIILLSFLLLFNACEKKVQLKKIYTNNNSAIIADDHKIRAEKLAEVKRFIKNKNYNQDLALFIDFKIPSGKYRFFIYDLKNDKILDRGIVAHGSGSVNENSEKLSFSNTEGSYMSSLGKYEIGTRYSGTFGWSYRLKGLDETNSNAMKRAVVLHSYNCISDFESLKNACLSLGCPMLSTQFFKTVEKYIESSKKPLLLLAYY